MKKSILIVMLILIAVFPNATSQESLNEFQNDPIIGNVQNVQGIYENITAEDTRGEYLSREWTKIFRNDPKLNWIYKLNPIFKFLFAQEFSLSWAFIAGFLIWVTLFSLFYPPVKTAFGDMFSSFGITIAISVIASHGVTPKTTEIMASLVKNVWHSLLAIVTLIFLLIIVSTLSNKFTRAFIEYRKKKAFAHLLQEARKNKAMREGAQAIKEGADAFARGYREGAD